MRKITFLIVFVMLAGCAKPALFTDQMMQTYDGNTTYMIEDMNDGFVLSVAYSRYQFFPESNALAISCKSQLTSIAWEHSDKSSRKIKPLNEQKIKISMGRNILTGITSCQAQVKVEWESTP